MRGHVSELATESKIDWVYTLDHASIRKAICNAVNRFSEVQFGGDGFDLPHDVRLDELAHAVRWHLSDSIVAETARAPENLEAWVTEYASYIRNDGGSAFRMGLEWCLARTSLYDSVASGIAERQTSDFVHAPRLADAVASDSEGLAAPELDQVVSWLRLRKYCNYTLDRGFEKRLKKTISEVKLRLDAIADPLCTHALDEEIRVGTLTMGILSPAEMTRSGYAEAIKAAEEYFLATATELNEHVRKIPNRVQGTFSSVFLPVIGDYSFITYLHRSTPVERDAHPFDLPKMLLKPRFLLQVYGKKSLTQRAPHRFTKISLLKFKQRWQWHALAERLAASAAAEDALLFLSSAWEDAILVTSHADEDSIWCNIKQLKLDVDYDSVDSQTSIAAVDLGESEPGVLHWTEGIENWAQSLILATLDGQALADIVNERTGRYDYTIVWNCPVEGKVIDQFCRIMRSLPAAFWSRVEAISTSFEHTIKAGAEDPSYVSAAKHRVVSHVLLNR